MSYISKITNVSIAIIKRILRENNIRLQMESEAKNYDMGIKMVETNKNQLDDNAGHNPTDCIVDDTLYDCGDCGDILK